MRAGAAQSVKRCTLPPVTPFGSTRMTMVRAAGALLIFCILTVPSSGFNTADLEKVRQTNRCGDCDLAGADMAGSVMNDVQMPNARIAGAKMAGADLSSGNLSGADLSGADLSRADLSYTNLWHVNLSKANLSGGRLIGARLQGANLTGANLSGADLAAVDLAGADLSGATWPDGKKCLEGSKGACKTGEPESQKTSTRQKGRSRLPLLPLSNRDSLIRQAKVSPTTGRFFLLTLSAGDIIMFSLRNL